MFFFYIYYFLYVLLNICLGSSTFFHNYKLLSDETIHLYCIITLISLYNFFYTRSDLKQNIFYLMMNLSLYIYARIPLWKLFFYPLQNNVFYQEDHKKQLKIIMSVVFYNIVECLTIIGHIGERETTYMTILNSRIFYVALSEIILLLTLIGCWI